jgi:hypothetical protein
VTVSDAVCDIVAENVAETVCVCVSIGDCVWELNTVTVGNSVNVVEKLRVPETVGSDNDPVVTVPVVVGLPIVSETVRVGVNVLLKVCDWVVETESERESTTVSVGVPVFVDDELCVRVSMTVNDVLVVAVTE